MLYKGLQKVVKEGVTFYDYLGFDGQEYIDTGFRAGLDGTLVATQQVTFTLNGNRQLFGTDGWLGYWGVNVNNVYELNNATTPQEKDIIQFVYQVRTGNSVSKEFKVNGVRKHRIDTGSIDEATYKTYVNGTPQAYKTSLCGALKYAFYGKLYWLKLTYDGELVRDMIPCKYNGVYGMWDLVEDKFYKNGNSTGTFAVGNEIDVYRPNQVKHIYRRSYNMLDIMQEGWKNGIYDYIDLPLDPNKAYTLLMDYNKATLADDPVKKGTIAMAIASRNYPFNANEWYTYFGHTGVKSSYGTKFTLPANGYKKQMYLYTKIKSFPTQEEWADAIEKWFGHIWIVEGNNVSKPYLPYLIDVSKVYKRSWNLFDFNKMGNNPNGLTSDKTNNTITITHIYSISTGVKLRTFCPNIEVGKTYYLSLSTTSKNKFIYLYGTNTQWGGNSTRTILETDLSSIVVFYGETDKVITISEVQITEGTTAKPYMPYRACVFSNLKGSVSDSVLSVNNTAIKDNVAAVEGENVSVNNNELIIE